MKDNDNNDSSKFKNMHKNLFKDMTGQHFGRLTVLGIDHKKGKIYYWGCLCECGNYTVVNGTSIRSVHTKSCGCLHKKSQLKDLVGMRFGNLVVISYSRQEGEKHLWNCRCDCGRTIEAIGRSLLKGLRKSCGCAKKKLKLSCRKYDLTNNKFGKLLALEPRNHSMWLCKCECGNFLEVKTADLTRGFTRSCGCLSVNFDGSKEENEIRDYVASLLPNTYITKAKILNSGKRKLEIDIYIPSLKFGIEYNGSAFHASENTLLGSNKPKHYHRNKFLIAKKQGIRLITVFDKDYEDNKELILNRIKMSLTLDRYVIPNSLSNIMYTDNDYDDGLWLRELGYEEDCQLEPDFFIHRKEKFKVYRCGKTKWVKTIPR